MEFLTKYCLPILTALLLILFYLQLPDLRRCATDDAGRERFRLGRADALIMAVISLLYAAAAFYRLGNTESPQTFVNMEGRSAEIELDPKSGGAVRLMIFEGVGIGEYSVTCTQDGGRTWHEVVKIEQSHADVLKWHEIALCADVSGGTIAISGTGNVWLGEVVALDAGGDVIPAKSSAPGLCDEQSLCPDRQTFMNSTYFDEIYHARTAWEHMNNVYPYEITHPPLGKLIISIGIAIFGMTPFGWRFSGTFFGVLMLPVMYVFAKKLFGGRAVPTACMLVFASDFMHYVQTRIATIDTYAVFFILLMYLFMYLFVSGGKWRDLALSGIFFGIGAASKWTCLYAGAGLAVIWLIWVLVQAGRGNMDMKKFWKLAGFCLIFFVLIPCVIYYLSYYPYGRARNAAIFSRDYLRIVLDNQTYMFNYHSGVTAEHPYSSRWYQWMLDIRPILYYLEYFDDGTHSSFGAFVNPALCWGGLLSLFVLIYMALFRRDKRAGFLLIAYFAQLIPWMFITRITFEYHYFPCAAFLVLTVGYVFNLMRQNEKHWELYVSGFTALSMALFVLFYPALSGRPVAANGLLSWLPTWPF